MMALYGGDQAEVVTRMITDYLRAAVTVEIVEEDRVICGEIAEWDGGNMRFRVGSEWVSVWDIVDIYV